MPNIVLFNFSTLFYRKDSYFYLGPHEVISSNSSNTQVRNLHCSAIFGGEEGLQNLAFFNKLKAAEQGWEGGTE